MPSDIIPAARILGANWITIFFKLILPLTREGLIIGGTLVFTGAVTAYITPAVLGGSKVLMLETLLYQRISIANDVATASVIAAILIAMSIVTHSLIRRLTSGKRSS
jgi:putative spermidine/putrescine transport system permease protein